MPQNMQVPFMQMLNGQNMMQAQSSVPMHMQNQMNMHNPMFNQHSMQQNQTPMNMMQQLQQHAFRQSNGEGKDINSKVDDLMKQ
jgi:hypothetical protein